MPPPLSPMAAIGAAVRILAENGGPEAALVAEALVKWSRLRNASLEEAAGWASNVPAVSMQRARDEALRRLARRFPGRSGRGLAETVHKTVRGYETTRWWTADHAANHRPDGLSGAKACRSASHWRIYRTIRASAVRHAIQRHRQRSADGIWPML
jgi:hypothetical protein